MVLEKQVLQQHSTLERIESDNGIHFKNNFADIWAREHRAGALHPAPASGKTEQYNGLLKITLKSVGGGPSNIWIYT